MAPLFCIVHGLSGLHSCAGASAALQWYSIASHHLEELPIAATSLYDFLFESVPQHPGSCVSITYVFLSPQGMTSLAFQSSLKCEEVCIELHSTLSWSTMKIQFLDPSFNLKRILLCNQTGVERPARRREHIEIRIDSFLFTSFLQKNMYKVHQTPSHELHICISASHLSIYGSSQSLWRSADTLPYRKWTFMHVRSDIYNKDFTRNSPSRTP
jgi:hypothetical protein